MRYRFGPAQEILVLIASRSSPGSDESAQILTIKTIDVTDE